MKWASLAFLDYTIVKKKKKGLSVLPTFSRLNNATQDSFVLNAHRRSPLCLLRKEMEKWKCLHWKAGLWAGSSRGWWWTGHATHLRGPLDHGDISATWVLPRSLPMWLPSSLPLVLAEGFGLPPIQQLHTREDSHTKLCSVSVSIRLQKSADGARNSCPFTQRPKFCPESHPGLGKWWRQVLFLFVLLHFKRPIFKSDELSIEKDGQLRINKTSNPSFGHTWLRPF